MLLGSHFFKKNGWKAGIFLLLTPMFFQQFFDFENAQFAYPLIYWGLYFFFTKHKWIGMLLVAASGLLWEGSIYVLLGLGLTFLPALLFWGVLVLFLDTQYFGLILYRFFYYLASFVHASESSPIISFPLMFFLLIGYFGWKNEKLREFLPILVYFSLLAGISGKFFMLLVPILSIYAVSVLEFPFFDKNFWKIKTTLLNWDEFLINLFKKYHMVLVLSMVFLVMVFTPALQPTQSQWEVIDYAIQESKGQRMNNDWDLGHWIRYHDGNSIIYAGLNREMDFFRWQGMVVTYKDTAPAGCILELEKDGLKAYKCWEDPES
jgi:hypothetical protein